MSLIKTVDQVKKHVSINNLNSLDSFKMDFDDIDENVTRKILGAAQYDELHTAIVDDSLTPEQTFLLEKAEKVTVNLGMAQNADIIQVQISESGISRSENDAFKYQKTDLQKYLKRKGYNAIETLLEFLEEQKDSYLLWKNDDAAYSINKQFFINSAKEFSEAYNIKNSRLTYMAFKYIIQDVEITHIEDAIGSEFFEVLKGEILTGTIPEATRKLLDKYIRPALAYLVVASAIDQIPLGMQDGALVIRELATDFDNEGPAADKALAELEKKKHQAEQRGMSKLEALKAHLNEKASDILYPAYFASSLYVAPVVIVRPIDPQRKIYGAF